MRRYVETNCLYRHFKGGLYYVVGIAAEVDTCDEFIVYHSVEDDCEMFIRTREDFMSDVPCRQINPTGQRYRFERIEKI